MSIRRKLFFIILAFTLVIIAAGYMLGIQSTQLVSFLDTDEIVEGIYKDATQSSRLTHQYLIHREKRIFQQLRLLHLSLERHLHQAGEILSQQESSHLLKNLSGTHDKLHLLLEKFIANEQARERYVRAGYGNEVRECQSLENILVTELETKTHDMVIIADQILLIERRSIQQNCHRNGMMMFSFLGFLGISVIVTALLLARRIIIKLTQLIDASREISAGTINNRVKVDGNDELRDLCLAFNRMSDSLQRSRDELHAKIAEIRESEERLEVTLRSIDNGVIATDRQGRVMMVNRAAEELVGWTEEEALDKPLSTIFSTLDRITGQALPDITEEVLQQGRYTKHPGQVMLVARDGIQHIIDQTAASIHHASGKVFGVVLAFSDISEQFHLAAERSRLINVIESTSDVIFIANPDLTIVYMNHAGLKLWGWEERGCLGCRFSDLQDQKELAIFIRDVLPTVRENDLWHGETKVRGTQGMEIPISLVAMAHRSSDGELTHFSFVMRDISERVRTEKEILSLRNLLRNIMDSMPSVLIGVDMNGKVIYWNTEAERMTGIASGHACGQRLRAVYPDLDQEIIMIEQAIRERRLVKNFRLLRTERDDQRYADMTVFPLVANGTEGAVIRIDDITEWVQLDEERKKLEEQLRQTQKLEAIGTLAGGVAHDFNNILTAIIGYGELVRTELPPGSDLLSDQEEVLKAAYRARELVKQILAFSRQKEQEYQPFYLHSVVKEALKLLRASIPTSIEKRHDIDMKSGAVMGDPTQILQIVMNLCTNAYHAMRERDSGIIGISLKTVEITQEEYAPILNLHPGTFIRLEVSDTGCGISRELMSRIFEPYFTTKKIGEGTGLGLSLVHGIVKNLKGHITVYSEPGKGSTFHVYLPQFDQDAASQDDGAGYTTTPGGTERLLIIDDEEAIVQLEKKILGALGYRVLSTTSSMEALRLFEAQPDNFDMVITDMNMPEMTGAVLAKKVFSIRKNMPVILCTGFSEVINEDKAKSLGIHGYIMKPLVKSELAGAVRRILNKYGRKK